MFIISHQSTVTLMGVWAQDPASICQTLLCCRLFCPRWEGEGSEAHGLMLNAYLPLQHCLVYITEWLGMLFGLLSEVWSGENGSTTHSEQQQLKRVKEKILNPNLMIHEMHLPVTDQATHAFLTLQALPNDGAGPCNEQYTFCAQTSRVQ